MRRKTFVLALIAALGTGTAASASTAQRSPRVSGTVVANTAPKWVRYNFTTCQYQPAPSGGTKFKLTMKSAPAGKSSIAYATQDEVYAFTVALNKSIQAAANKAGFHLTLYNNQLNNTAVQNSAPLQNATNIAAAKPSVVLWMNTLSALTAQSMNTFNAVRPCLPVVQFYIAPGHNAIYFGNSQPEQGIVSADYLAPIIKQRHWNLSQTWLVSTGDLKSFGNASGSPQERVTSFGPQVRKFLPQIPESHIVVLNCSTTPECRTDMADWITSHPQAKYVAGATIYDIRALGAYAALKAAGFGSRALLVGNGEEPSVTSLVDKHDKIMVGDLDAGEQNAGAFVIPLAEDILAGKPVPSQVYIPVKVYQGKGKPEVIPATK